jgi:hypothetical protein
MCAFCAGAHVIKVANSSSDYSKSSCTTGVFSTAAELFLSGFITVHRRSVKGVIFFIGVGKKKNDCFPVVQP